MISNLAYTSKNLYVSNELKFKPICLLSSLNTISLYTKSFYYLVNTLTYTINTADIYIREKFLLYLASFSFFLLS